MLGKRSPQMGLFDADHLYLDMVGRDSFYGFLSSQRGQMFRDTDFAALYCEDNGRKSVAPSVLATVLLLQAYDKVSDEEAKARADFDLRWKVALGIGIEERPFAKSTLQLFRAHLILHEQVQRVFEASLRFARQTGYFRKRKVKVVLDTSYILGRGAVRDTYNLLSDGIVQLARTLAALSGQKVTTWARQQKVERYFGSSVKGEAGVDWDDASQRKGLLQVIVADADRLLELARAGLADCAAGSVQEVRLREAAQLLGQLLLQDIERQAGGAIVKQEVSAERVISVHDPEMRHGHKSKRRLFDGHKAAVAVECESQLITAVRVLPGNAPDSDGALELVAQSERSAKFRVKETVADCAYGDGATRQAFHDAGRVLRARLPGRKNLAHFDKEDFLIDAQTQTCRCPAGQECRALKRSGSSRYRGGERRPHMVFEFDAKVCATCTLRSNCTSTRRSKGRSVTFHAQEALLQEARRFQRSPAWAQYRRLRQVAEHRLARLMQLGVRQSRYFGRKKALFQLLMAATVANLTLVAGKVGLMGRTNGCPRHCFCFVLRPFKTIQDLLRSFLTIQRLQTPVFV